MPELKWDELNTEAAWAAVTADAQLQEALVERLKMLALEAGTQTGEASLAEAPGPTPSGLTAGTQVGFTRALKRGTFQLAGAEGDVVQLEWDEKPVPGVQIRQAAAAAANRLTSDTTLPDASVQQAPTAAAETLVVGPGLSAAAIAQAGTVHPDTAESRAASGSVNAEQAATTAPAGLTSGTASENPLVQQAATITLPRLESNTTTGQVGASSIPDELTFEQAGDTMFLDFRPDEGMFEPDFRKLNTAGTDTATGQVAARPATDDFRVGRVEGDTSRLRWDSSNKGQFS